MPHRANIELDTVHLPDTYRMTPYGFAQTAEPRQFVVTCSRQISGAYQTFEAAAAPNFAIPPNWIALPASLGEVAGSTARIEVVLISDRQQGEA